MAGIYKWAREGPGKGPEGPGPSCTRSIQSQRHKLSMKNPFLLLLLTPAVGYWMLHNYTVMCMCQVLILYPNEVAHSDKNISPVVVFSAPWLLRYCNIFLTLTPCTCTIFLYSWELHKYFTI